MKIQKTAFQHIRYIWAVNAVFPSPHDERPKHDNSGDVLRVPHPTATYFMQVAGDSMLDADIHAGDIIMVDRSLLATHQHLVVDRVGDELLLSRLWKADGRVLLTSAHPASPPIDVTHRADVELCGVVTGVIHVVSDVQKSIELESSKEMFPPS
jgi:DNA polymerase V